ncbi:DUF2382 domain-containing protein [Blastococcus sp. Marseille-P5729]|uniref:DUF2382 domain-containing protein n=1 Tax=Blastococcus sp. Marseille-P5729 TaxID=2086582 RepID=UPI000D0EEABC|nr:PRC and DUF2382 domain-containing protein [Blastococcus sp. Marseille-P5729]
MSEKYTIDSLFDATVYDQDGDKVGGVSQVYTDDQTQEPTWVSVNTGLFGTNETLIPLADARISGEEIHVPYEKGFIKDAPNVDADHHLDADDERRLYEYFGDRDYRAAEGYDRDYYEQNYRDAAVAGGGVDVERDRDVADRDRTRDRDVADGDEVVRHEERVNVGTETQEAGRARLRKHVVTEKRTVEVPVKREELRVERTPINDGDGKAATGAELGEGEQDIILREERPVVEKEVVAAEKINVGKTTVEGTEQVQADVRKEEVEIDGDVRGDVDGDGRRDRR